MLRLYFSVSKIYTSLTNKNQGITSHISWISPIVRINEIANELRNINSFDIANLFTASKQNYTERSQSNRGNCGHQLSWENTNLLLQNL